MKRALCTLLILLLTAAVPALAENAIPKAGDETIFLRVLRLKLIVRDPRAPESSRITQGRPATQKVGENAIKKRRPSSVFTQNIQ